MKKEELLDEYAFEPLYFSESYKGRFIYKSESGKVMANIRPDYRSTMLIDTDLDEIINIEGFEADIFIDDKLEWTSE
jgi:hypothetical protein